MQKVAIVGAGRVGETTAQILAEQETCREVVLIDIREDAPQGVALDIAQTAPLFRFDTRVTGSNDPAAMAGADLVVITAGVPRKPGMSRSDVLEVNVKVIDGIVDDVLRYAPEAVIIMVTNPVDVLTWRAWTRTGWPRARVLGQAGVLDASRMAAFIAMETGFSVRDITTIVLGGHGDAMVPVARFCTVNGVPVSHFLEEDRLEEIVQRTRDGGAEILSLRKISSAYDAPGAAVAEMVDAIARNRRRLLPCVAILEGEYGERDIAMGVPCVLDRSGLTYIVDLGLNAQEQAAFAASAAGVRADIERLPPLPGG
ncbi:malate dehydrogenase [endosymbiont of unidentified scaly snail isolate Monju]|uniref:malate dehydrogenase n=1 Tax=endosymbiont of unidentified scaly snail isolate Monju TaxID=1248727 RepID=UPI0003892CAA|nr:malate dehydrogenase [endosymbiont of unidentified scaly snail isolate Monju]BAN70202.1 malate dehydrogenase [endosymbiont of unidentified scaly snail isolate Monju]